MLVISGILIFFSWPALAETDPCFPSSVVRFRLYFFMLAVIFLLSVWHTVSSIIRVRSRSAEPGIDPIIYFRRAIALLRCHRWLLILMVVLVGLNVAAITLQHAMMDTVVKGNCKHWWEHRWPLELLDSEFISLRTGTNPSITLLFPSFGLSEVLPMSLLAIAALVSVLAFLILSRKIALERFTRRLLISAFGLIAVIGLVQAGISTYPYWCEAFVRGSAMYRVIVSPESWKTSGVYRLYIMSSLMWTIIMYVLVFPLAIGSLFGSLRRLDLDKQVTMRGALEDAVRHLRELIPVYTIYALVSSPFRLVALSHRAEFCHQIAQILCPVLILVPGMVIIGGSQGFDGICSGVNLCLAEWRRTSMFVALCICLFICCYICSLALFSISLLYEYGQVIISDIVATVPAICFTVLRVIITLAIWELTKDLVKTDTITPSN